MPHLYGSNGPWFTALAGAVILAPLSFPAGAASGNWVAPGAALLAWIGARRRRLRRGRLPSVNDDTDEREQGHRNQQVPRSSSSFAVNYDRGAVAR